MIRTRAELLAIFTCGAIVTDLMIKDLCDSFPILSSNAGIALGIGASASGNTCIQVGSGTNLTDNSIQVGGLKFRSDEPLTPVDGEIWRDTFGHVYIHSGGRTVKIG